MTLLGIAADIAFTYLSTSSFVPRIRKSNCNFITSFNKKFNSVNIHYYKIIIVELSTKVNSEFIHYDKICINKQKNQEEIMNFYQRIRDLREDRDLNQETIAKILNISQSDYSKYELGKHMMGIDKYIILAKYYNVSIDYLAGIIDVPEKLNRF